MWILEIKIVGDDTLLEPLYKEQIDKHMMMIQNDKYSDSGFDIYCPLEHTNVETTLVDTQIQCALYEYPNDIPCSEVKEKEHLKPSAYYMYTRSSIYKTCYRLANNAGIIDSGYRGNLKAAMDYHDFANAVPTLEQGKRYWQLCAPDLKPFDIVRLVDDLDETNRGSGGHGSTGN